MGRKHIILWLLGICAAVFSGYAQQRVAGVIYDSQSDSIVQDVLIINLNTKESTYGSKEGKYSIAAAEGHKLVYSAVGYAPDTVLVEFYMFVTGYDISLKPRFTTLKTVVVTDRNYQQDSIERRNAYRHLFDNRPAGITGGNTPQNGVGIVLSPGSFFSKKNRQERELRKKLEQDEEAEYVNYRFSPNFVRQYTGLKGDSLQSFMLRFRPSYEFCRKANHEDMVNYINDKLKIYLRRDEQKSSEN
ncbi:MAG TPA: hypothetical protein VIK80_13400 [Flavihumibacter sp.]